MTDKEAFEKCLVADPNEDVTRLAYADWLEEQDDPKLVELGGRLRGPDAKQAVNEFATFRRMRWFGRELSLESVFQTIKYRREWMRAAKDEWLRLDAAVLSATRDRLRSWSDIARASTRAVEDNFSLNEKVRVDEKVHRKAMEVSPNPLRRFAALLKTKLTRKDRRT